MNGGSRFKLWKSIEGDHSRAVSHARRGGLALLLMQGTTLPTAGLLFEGGQSRMIVNAGGRGKISSRLSRKKRLF